MQQFCKKYKISNVDYEEFRENILNQKSPQAIKKFRDLSRCGLSESSSILFKEFNVEKRLSDFKQVYNSFQRVNAYFNNSYIENNFSEINTDVGILLEFIKEQLSK